MKKNKLKIFFVGLVLAPSFMLYSSQPIDQQKIEELRNHLKNVAQLFGKSAEPLQTSRNNYKLSIETDPHN